MKEMSQFFSSAIYIVSMVFQILIPCYGASIVTDESEKLPLNIFYSNWTSQSNRFKSSMAIFVERAKQPIQPMAGGVFKIGLPIFVSVSIFSFSAFMS